MREPAAAAAAGLLARARAEYDRPGSPLPALARAERAGGFAGGACWMAAALAQLRGRPIDVPPGASFHRLGFVKYAMASAAASVAAVLSVAAGLPWPVAVLAAVPAFYAAEVQMVFLFPAAIDGSRRPFRDGRRLMRRAGGTGYAARVVVRLAAHMLFGGLVGRGGPLRAWCAGCLAVCLWYEDARATNPAVPPARPPRLEVGGSGDLLTRVERVRVGGRGPDAGAGAGACRGLTLVYASDLHLGRPWTRRVAGEVLAAARVAAPDAVLLGGDLVDGRRGVDELAGTVRALAAVAPVYAVPGNHDERVGVGRVRDGVRAGGGRWLPDGGGVLLPGRVWLSGAAGDVPPACVAARVLCAHDPAVFPLAAAAGFDLVLAGHLHGGQCVLAERDGLLYPGALVNRWTGLRFDGWPGKGGGGGRPTMLVCRGAADTLPVRWNCRREVLVCRVTFPAVRACVAT